MKDSFEFDELIKSEIGELPPSDQMVEAVSPWRKSMQFIAAGTVLMSITLKLMSLDMLLPALGMVLMILGVHIIRDVNRLTKAAYIITLIYAAYFTVSLFIYYSGAASGNSNVDMLTAIGTLAFKGMLLLVLRAGIIRECRAAEYKPSRDPLLWLVIWNVVVTVMAIIEADAVLAMGMAVWLIFIVVSMFRYGGEIASRYFKVPSASAGLNGKALAVVFIVLCVIAAGAGSIRANHLPLSYSRVASGSLTAAQQTLVSRGMPAKVAADLSAADAKRFLRVKSFKAFRSTRHFLSAGDKTEKAHTDMPKVYTYLVGGMTTDGKLIEINWFSVPKNKTSARKVFAVKSLSAITMGAGCRALYDRGDSTYAAGVKIMGKGNTNDGYSYAASQFSMDTGGTNQRAYIWISIDPTTNRYYNGEINTFPQVFFLGQSRMFNMSYVNGIDEAVPYSDMESFTFTEHKFDNIDFYNKWEILDDHGNWSLKKFNPEY